MNQDIFSPQWQQLKQAITMSRLGHAYILSGEAQDEIYEFSLKLVESEICHTKKGCKSCEACRQFKQHVHPDVRIVTKEKSSITIEQIRELNHFLMHKSSSGHKWIIIESAHLLNLAASQALLKTLEEPNQATFFLVTSQKLKLIPTIRSRCQSLNFYLTPKINPLDYYHDYLLVIKGSDSLIKMAQKWQATQEPRQVMSQFYELMIMLLKIKHQIPLPLEYIQNSTKKEWEHYAHKMNMALFIEFLNHWRSIQIQLQSNVHYNTHLLFNDLLLRWKAIWKNESLN